MSNNKLREALTKVSDVLETWCDHLPPIIQDEAKEALALADEAIADIHNEEAAEIREGILKSIAECDTSITGWSVEYTQGCVIPKVKIPRAVYEILLAAFREVCRVKLVLRKDEGGAK